MAREARPKIVEPRS